MTDETERPYVTGIDSTGLRVRIRGGRWRLVLSRADMESGDKSARKALQKKLRQYNLTIPGWSLAEHKRRVKALLKAGLIRPERKAI